jgi:hypothetical protein
MMARAGVLLFTVALGLVGSWLFGYHEGQRTGAYYLLRQMDKSSDYEIDLKNAMDTDRDKVCSEIKSYKLSMARDLDENTQICGWPDMDGPENSK